MKQKWIDVYWTTFAGKDASSSLNSSFQHGLFFEPEPLLNHIVDTRDKNVRYLKCPAVKDYMKTTYVVRSPIDLTFEVKLSDAGIPYCNTLDYDQQFFDTFVHQRFSENTIPMMSLEFSSYIFYSEESLMVEQLHPTLSMSVSEIARKTSVIGGTFDISQWIRPVTFSFEVVDLKTPITIKRGDPLYYVRFNTDRPVKLHRVEFSKDLKDVTDACLSVKNFVQNNSMRKNYEILNPFIKFKKEKLFGSKCPFSRWFK